MRCHCLLSAGVDHTRLEIPHWGGVLTPTRVRRVVEAERRSGRGYLDCQVKAVAVIVVRAVPARPLPPLPLSYVSPVRESLVLSVRSGLDRIESPSPGHGHSHGGGHEGGGLVADAVQPDLRGGLLRLQRGRQRRGGGTLHPRVVDDVLERRAVGWPQGQTPFDQMLALWGGEGRLVWWFWSECVAQKKPAKNKNRWRLEAELT